MLERSPRAERCGISLQPAGADLFERALLLVK